MLYCVLLEFYQVHANQCRQIVLSSAQHSAWDCSLVIYRILEKFGYTLKFKWTVLSDFQLYLNDSLTSKMKIVICCYLKNSPCYLCSINSKGIRMSDYDIFPRSILFSLCVRFVNFPANLVCTPLFMSGYLFVLCFFSCLVFLLARMSPVFRNNFFHKSSNSKVLPDKLCQS